MWQSDRKKVELQMIEAMQMIANELHQLNANLSKLQTVPHEIEKVHERLSDITKVLIVNRGVSEESETPDAPALFDEETPIRRLGFSSRTYNALSMYGYKTAGSILKASKESLTQIRGIGKESYKEIRSKMLEYFNVNIDYNEDD